MSQIWFYPTPFKNVLFWRLEVVTALVYNMLIILAQTILENENYTSNFKIRSPSLYSLSNEFDGIVKTFIFFRVILKF
jgi:hypothetical protein